ncbi:hypothetical protein EJ04DRAFT_196752 [Polyplosphaeria fusca]|uniref:Uncharacterized protein n=1 Tax=Polyplosphaeria fusca TaxID=682080 RepID=A0A9P4V9B0_9PLEO|nr:hypothetical protein EJ04DRAFT_196752 [Polyplosphaeria fusca]
MSRLWQPFITWALVGFFVVALRFGYYIHFLIPSNHRLKVSRHPSTVVISTARKRRIRSVSGSSYPVFVLFTLNIGQIVSSSRACGHCLLSRTHSFWTGRRRHHTAQALNIRRDDAILALWHASSKC